MILSDLKSEILNNAALKALYDQNTPATDQQLVDALNQKNPVIQPLALVYVIIWTAKYGIKKRLAAHTADADPIGSICDAALLMLSTPHIQNLDLNDAEVKGMFDALLAAGIISQAESDDLMARATIQQSIADKLGGPITYEDGWIQSIRGGSI